MTSPPSTINVSSALGLGLREAVSLASSTLALFAARAMAGLAIGSLGWTLLGSWLVGRAPVGLAAAGGLLVCWLAFELLAGVVLTGALAQGKARLLGEPVPRFTSSVFSEASRGLSFPLWAFVVQLFVTLWRWSALWATGILYLRAIERGSGGLWSAGALALAIVLALPLSLLAMVWLRVSLVDAVHGRRPMGVALFESVGLLRRHLFAPLSLILIAAILAGVAEGIVSGTLAPLANPSSFSPERLELAVLATLAGGILAAFPAALFELTGWHGLMALRLSWAGTLPSPEPRQAPARATHVPLMAGAAGGFAGGEGAVVQARPVAPGPIIDARPVVQARAPDLGDAAGAPASGVAHHVDGSSAETEPVSGPEGAGAAPEFLSAGAPPALHGSSQPAADAPGSGAAGEGGSSRGTTPVPEREDP